MKYSVINGLHSGAVLLISCLLSACSPLDAASNFFEITQNVISPKQVQKLEWEVDRTIGGYQFVARLEVKDALNLADLLMRTSEASAVLKSDRTTIKLTGESTDSICITEIPGSYGSLVEKASWWDLKVDGSLRVRLQRGKNVLTHDGVHWWIFPSDSAATNVIYVVGSGS